MLPGGINRGRDRTGIYPQRGCAREMLDVLLSAKLYWGRLAAGLIAGAGRIRSNISPIDSQLFEGSCSLRAERHKAKALTARKKQPGQHAGDYQPSCDVYRL